MPSEHASPPPAAFQQTATELRRLHEGLQRTVTETSQLLEQLSSTQRQQQQLLEALGQVQGGLETLLAGGEATATEPATRRSFSEREATRWSYEQLQAGAQNEPDLLATFTHDFALPAQQLVAFLSNHRFFRKTGTGATAAWMISGNRHDDLRDYLAE